MQIPTRWGSFEIHGLLGKGGMGEVYRAHDSKLDRDVAIKVLPEVFATDQDRLARFQREARMLASLNCSNIAQIYGLEESGETRFLVLELVDGETLAERLKRGPIPIEEALAIARQIALGLEAAHEKGITHRDLKPANIKITTAEQVKILDFGLAKVNATDPISGAADSPTMLSGTPSQLNVILGTAAYMSPEQVRSKPADGRSDIWAFGCVLYEMLGGKPAFDGESIVEIMGGIIKTDPDWSALPQSTPARIRSLIRRCLQKQWSGRLRDIGDARLEIEEVLASPEPETGLAVLPRRSGMRERVAWILAVTGMLGAIALAFVHWRERAIIATPVEFTLAELDDPGMLNAIGTSDLVVSPDGRTIAFRATGAAKKVPSIWLRPLDSLKAREIPGTEGASSAPAWSPDGRLIAFQHQGKLKKIETVGGIPQTLCEASGGMSGIAWGPANFLVFMPGQSIGIGQLFKVSAGGGNCESLYDDSVRGPAEIQRWASFLPDGRRFLTVAGGKIFINSVDSKDRRPLFDSDSKAVYAEPGYLFFVRQATLLAQPFDVEQAKLTGEAVPIAEGLETASFTGNSGGGASTFSVSGATLLFRKSRPENYQIAWYDRTGKRGGSLDEKANYQGVALSPDGTRIATHIHDFRGGDIYLFDLVRGTKSRFTFNPDLHHAGPVWSRDGTQVIYDRSGKPGAYLKPVGGGGTEKALTVPEDYDLIGLGSKTDSLLLLHKGNPWVLSLAEGSVPVQALQSPSIKSRVRFSPDGRWLVYVSNETGSNQVHVQPYPPTGSQWQISTKTGQLPLWAPNGREIFYIEPIQTRGDAMVMAVDITPAGASLTVGVPRPLFRVPLSCAGCGHFPWAVFPDGQRFLITTLLDQPDPITPVTAILNWTQSLMKN